MIIDLNQRVLEKEEKQRKEKMEKMVSNLSLASAGILNEFAIMYSNNFYGAEGYLIIKIMNSYEEMLKTSIKAGNQVLKSSEGKDILLNSTDFTPAIDLLWKVQICIDRDRLLGSQKS